MITRRSMLAGTAALSTMPVIGRRALASSTLELELTAAPAMVQIAPEGYPQTEIWGYGGAVPGTEIRALQGTRLRRRLIHAYLTSTPWQRKPPHLLKNPVPARPS